MVKRGQSHTGKAGQFISLSEPCACWPSSVISSIKLHFYPFSGVRGSVFSVCVSVCSGLWHQQLECMRVPVAVDDCQQTSSWASWGVGEAVRNLGCVCVTGSKTRVEFVFWRGKGSKATTQETLGFRGWLRPVVCVCVLLCRSKGKDPGPATGWTVCLRRDHSPTGCVYAGLCKGVCASSWTAAAASHASMWNSKDLGPALLSWPSI